uniref:Transmembrane protein n=1 Tax=Mesocestoides corti TaxID=53468 RepID=A0A5K3FJ14_MESCO
MLDLDDPEGPIKSKMALGVWTIGFAGSLVLAFFYCPTDWNGPACTTGRYMAAFFVLPIVVALAAIYAYVAYLEHVSCVCGLSTVHVGAVLITVPLTGQPTSVPLNTKTNSKLTEHHFTVGVDVIESH